jgi:hypothetical protein
MGMGSILYRSIIRVTYSIWPMIRERESPAKSKEEGLKKGSSRSARDLVNPVTNEVGIPKILVTLY